MSRVLNFACFQLGWLGCVSGAARGWTWLGPALAMGLVLLHLALAADRAWELRLILLAGLFGFAVDTLLASAGFFAFTRTSTVPWLSPPWMVALWVLFATTLNGSMSWLAGRYGLAAVLGALFAPLSYAAGARFGAIELPERWILGLAGVGTAWAFAMPALLILRDRSSRSLRRGVAVAVAGAWLIVAASIEPAAAREVEGVRFAERHRSEEVTMRLNCVALLRYKFVFRAYAAALYLGDGVAPGDVLADVPKRLELSYFWGIRGADLAAAGDEILARNVDPRALARLRSRLDRLNALYQDVEPGDRYSLTYVPGRGTELALNGRRLGVIDGADFASAYFRIWLGDRPIDATLRDELLGCRDSLPGEGRVRRDDRVDRLVTTRSGERT